VIVEVMENAALPAIHMAVPLRSTPAIRAAPQLGR
jgi:hypothetical protein